VLVLVVALGLLARKAIEDDQTSTITITSTSTIEEHEES
jgi:hypothetical protein